MDFTMDQVKDAVESKGYAFFTSGSYNVNIVGIRNSDTCNRVTNHYDDLITISFKKKDNGPWYYHQWKATTDPGKFWMDHPLNKKGCAILVPNQYRSVYTIDKHRNKYYALCQRNGSVEVYRDGNENDVYDLNPETTDKGYFGINIHRSSAYETSTRINKYSAGCQVFADPLDFKQFMNIVRKSSKVWGNDFTYTLIESEDISI